VDASLLTRAVRLLVGASLLAMRGTDRAQARSHTCKCRFSERWIPHCSRPSPLARSLQKASRGGESSAFFNLSESTNMKIQTTLRILVGALSFAGGLALAGEKITDSTEFQVRTANGVVEKVKIDDLAVGEVRNVNSERGTSVVVGRHENGYVLDIAGERIEVNTPDMQSLSTQKELVINGDGNHEQIVIKLDDHDKAKGAQTQRRVVVVKPDGADGKTIRIEEGDGADQLVHQMDLNNPELGDKRVIVVRKVEKTVTDGQD